MRHSREVLDERFSSGVFSQQQWDHQIGIVEDPALEQFSQNYRLPLLVGDLDPHRWLAGNRRHHPNTLGGERHRQVVGESDNLLYLGSCGETHLVLGDHRAALHIGHSSLDLEGTQGILDASGDLIELFLALLVIDHRRLGEK